MQTYQTEYKIFENEKLLSPKLDIKEVGDLFILAVILHLTDIENKGVFVCLKKTSAKDFLQPEDDEKLGICRLHLKCFMMK